MRDPGGPDVLLAVKPGKASPHAEGRAFQLASASGGKVRLIHVIEDPDQAAATDPDRLAEALSRRAPPAANWDIEVVRGEPWRIILEVADRRGCGLIVMGPRDRSGPAARLLGATGEHVIHRARQPVLTVRRPAGSPYRQVLAGTDYSEASRQALVIAAPWIRSAEITLLHAYRVPYEGFISRAANADEVRAQAEAEGDRFLSDAAWPPELLERVEHELAYGTPLEVIAARVEQGRTDLVVVGAHGQTGPFEKLLGGTAEQLLEQLPADLMVVGEREDRDMAQRSAGMTPEDPAPRPTTS